MVDYIFIFIIFILLVRCIALQNKINIIRLQEENKFLKMLNDRINEILEEENNK